MRIDSVDCACYTHARRHPEVLGRIGRTVLPVQITAPALVAWCSSFVGLAVSWSRWWSAFVPFGFAVVVILCVPLGLGWLAMVTSVGGRDPFLAAIGLLRYVCRVRGGVVNGRAVPRRRSMWLGRARVRAG